MINLMIRNCTRRYISLRIYFWNYSYCRWFGYIFTVFRLPSKNRLWIFLFFNFPKNWSSNEIDDSFYRFHAIFFCWYCLQNEHLQSNVFKPLPNKCKALIRTTMAIAADFLAFISMLTKESKSRSLLQIHILHQRATEYLWTLSRLYFVLNIPFSMVFYAQIEDLAFNKLLLEILHNLFSSIDSLAYALHHSFADWLKRFCRLVFYRYL